MDALHFPAVANLFPVNDVKFPSYEHSRSQISQTSNVKREGILRSIDGCFIDGKARRVSSIVLLCGLPGSGKTRVARDVLEQHTSEGRLAYWFDASSQNILDTGFLRFAEGSGLLPSQSMSDMQARDIQGKILKFLVHLEMPWTLVFDNYDIAEEPEGYDISKYIPRGGLGWIIITSRNRAVSQAVTLPCQEVILEKMNDEESTKLFMNYAGYQDGCSISKYESGLICTVASKLAGALPLAVAQAGSYVRCMKQGQSMIGKMEQYIDAFHQHQDILLGGRNAKFIREYGKSVLSTLKMSFDLIEEKDVLAAKVLLLCAFFHHNEIKIDWFRKACAARLRFPKSGIDLHLKGYTWFGQLIKPLRDGSWDSILMDECLELLANYALIQYDVDNETFSIHPLVHAWTLTHQTSAMVDAIELQARLALAILVESIPDPDSADGIGQVRVLSRIDLNRHLEHWIKVAQANTDLLTIISSNPMSGYSLGRLASSLDSPALSPEYRAKDMPIFLHALCLTQALKEHKLASKYILIELMALAMWVPNVFNVDRRQVSKIVDAIEDILNKADNEGRSVESASNIRCSLRAHKAAILRRGSEAKALIEDGFNVVEKYGDDLSYASKLQWRSIYSLLLFHRLSDIDEKAILVDQMQGIYQESCKVLG